MQNRLTSAVLVTAALLFAGSSTLRAQRLAPDGVSLAVGPLHTDAAGFGASFTGSYVLSNGVLALSLAPLDLGIGLGAAAGYQEAPAVGTAGTTVCRDRSGAEVSAIRCNATLRYGASAQLVGLLATGANRAIGLGVGYRAFDAPSPYAVASIELATVRDARLHLRARGGPHFYDLAIGATLRLEGTPNPQRPPVN
jgi:hypothetical protein